MRIVIALLCTIFVQFGFSKDYLAVDDFECGVYRISGKLNSHKGIKEYLSVYPESDRHFELDLSKVPLDLIGASLSNFVTIEAQMVDKKDKKNRSLIFSKDLGIATNKETFSNPIVKIKSLPCQ